MTLSNDGTDTAKQDAIRRIAESIGSHQAVKLDDGVGWTCRHRLCAHKGIVFLTLRDRYNHQAIVAVSDLLDSMRYHRELELEDQGVPDEDLDDDFTFSVLTDLLDANPAGRPYAERVQRKSRQAAAEVAR